MNKPKEPQIKKYSFSPTPEEAHQRLDKFLTSKFNFSRSKIQKLIHEGNVQIDNNVIDIPHHTIKANETIEIHIPPPIPSECKAENIPLDIIYEDNHLLLVNKPAGLVVHPAGGIG